MLREAGPLERIWCTGNCARQTALIFVVLGSGPGDTSAVSHHILPAVPSAAFPRRAPEPGVPALCILARPLFRIQQALGSLDRYIALATRWHQNPAQCTQPAKGREELESQSVSQIQRPPRFQALRCHPPQPGLWKLWGRSLVPGVCEVKPALRPCSAPSPRSGDLLGSRDSTFHTRLSPQHLPCARPWGQQSQRPPLSSRSLVSPGRWRLQGGQDWGRWRESPTLPATQRGCH